ncbi:molybdenum cofactor biosynthesis protein MoaE [Paenalcaligenes niemegkensis]|uniref:molybdenum cofactor biosynthesis protein MoaE n=1 Tax=Paenalcaligenes niemegkensis TaxID=2895469 RepID=UPI001EE799B4|nr:molybdenum cofactor biosynthesis protein MoaE [Paenalcaligenes niemegkensis]MCQ9617192.1 molybdenum cofactor biosynthesis protein MoaE [Paenalcaligenes niemegkensis]
MITVQENDFDVAQLIAELHAVNAGHTGALLSFIGYVRDYDTNTPTQTLVLEHYPGMCEREIQEICDHALERWDILNYRVVHRVGALNRNEQIVFVGVSSAHRGEAFNAAEYIIDALKTRAPFWKREVLADGKQFWVQQSEEDALKTAHWEANTDKQNP